jgi:hypothetical protein
MPVIIEFSRCIGTYSSAKFEFIIYKFDNLSYLNTGHWWQLLRMDMTRATMIVIRHRYPGIKKYHLQCHVHTFNKAINIIKDHDAYILAKNELGTTSIHPHL